MKPNSLLRREARSVLEKSWNFSALLTLIFFFFVFLVEFTRILLEENAQSPYCYVAIGIVYLLISPFFWNFTTVFLQLYRSNAAKSNRMLFKGYRRMWSSFITMLQAYVYIILWSFLFFVPGITKLYSYAMVPYIMLDNPDMRYGKAVRESRRMMKGYKFKLLILHLSFTGWFILSLLSFGIGLLWLIPYIYTSEALFYEDIKKHAA